MPQNGLAHLFSCLPEFSCGNTVTAHRGWHDISIISFILTRTGCIRWFGVCGRYVLFEKVTDKWNAYLMQMGLVCDIMG